MNGEYEVRDIFLATVFLYNGVRCVKVEGMGGKDTVWTFRVSSCDAEIIVEEYQDPEFAVLAKPWADSFRFAQELQKRAKDALGVWTSREYVGAA